MRSKDDKLGFDVLLHWRGSTLGFSLGEGNKPPSKLEGG